MNENVDKDTEDKCASNGSDGHFTKVENKSAYTGDEDNGYREEVFVFTEVNALNHLQAGYGDKAVKCYANAAHNASGNGGKKRREGSDEGSNDCHDGSSEDGYDGSVAGDSDTTDGFTVSGVGATAEECTCDRADTVTEEGLVKAGIFKKVFLDDGGKVLVVCDMLCEYDECYGDISNRDGADVSRVNIFEALECMDEGEIGEPLHIFECREVDNLKSGVVCCDTDYGEDSSYGIACCNTENEGNHFHHLLAVYGASDGHTEGDKTAKKAEIRISFCNAAFFQIADSVSCKRKTDDSDGRTDNDSGHKFCNPFNAAEFNDEGECYVNETCKYGAEKQTGKAGSVGDGACKSSTHRTEECEGRTKEYRALEFGKQEINESTYAGTEESRGSAHAVTDDSGNCDGCSKDSQELLKSEDEDLFYRGFVFDIVDEFHFLSSKK